MIYYDLSIPFRSLLILGLFTELCFGAYLLFTYFLRKNHRSRNLILLSMAVSGILMIIYTAEARANLRSLKLPAVSDWLCRQSVLLPVVVLLVILAVELSMFLDDLKFRRNTITRSSIKEGIDKISSGLCFYQDGGRVILANSRMNELCFRILGRDLQNAELFWQILSSGEVQPGVARLSSGSRPGFRLPDGQVWTFSREEIDGIYQLSAADTTQIYAVTEELKQKNTELEALNLRLRKYGENVDELTRAKERLETKSRIHSELGQALLSSRRFLLSGGEEGNMPLEQWKQNIAMLRKETQFKEEEKPLDMLQRIAAATGIATQITGVLPEEEQIQKRFVEAAAEALTNAISHAQARTLYIELDEAEGCFRAAFRNDGIPPQGQITEGGGLGSLRKKLEREGGTMTVSGDPDFVLTITLPKNGGQMR